MKFPVEEVIERVQEALARNRSVVLRAPPGSGKTTVLPLALLQSPFLKGRKILMLEPRRLAARACATFMAHQLGERCGETVGYQVRLERQVSAQTKLEILTEGLLSQRLLSDPELSDVGLVIFDEFHERSLACDLAFALTLDVRRNLREDLRLLVMSATLNETPLAEFLGDAEVVCAEGTCFDVHTRYLKVPSSAPIALQMAGAVKRVTAETTGDVLCFLPGEGEIRACAQALAENKLTPSREVFPLYGALPKSEQDAVLHPTREAPARVILATSLAETSLTIPRVTAVIDSGLMRVSRFSPRSGMSHLETMPLTRDRADQRRGRAGRVCAGLCLRLWTAEADRSLKSTMPPEILQADLTSTVLTAACWGSSERTSLPFLTPPPSDAWACAQEVLRLLGALDESNRLTAHGRVLASRGVHPRLANMMSHVPEAAYWAAILEEMPRAREVDLTFLKPSPRASELARRWGFRASHGVPSPDCLMFAFPDRMARNRGNGTFQMVCGRGAFLPRTEPLAQEPFLVLCELDDQAGDAKILRAVAVSQEQIEAAFSAQIRTQRILSWSRTEEEVKGVQQRVLGRMVLSEKPLVEWPPDDVQQALFEGIRQKGITHLPCWTPERRNLQARICFVQRVCGQAPDVSDAALEAHLDDWFQAATQGFKSWKDLARLDLNSVFDTALNQAQFSRRTLDRLAPLKWPMPKGFGATIHYETHEPYIAVKVQDCFGLKETPFLAEGRIPLTVHLLSPAQRPVQVTKDLASFWRTSYALVRKDLRGRYPRHAWPENPLDESLFKKRESKN